MDSYARKIFLAFLDADLDQRGPVCNLCRGTGLCPKCLGGKFLRPRNCSKCRKTRGNCPRCEGLGTRSERTRSLWPLYARAVKDSTGRWPRLAQWDPETEFLPDNRGVGGGWMLPKGEPLPQYPYNVNEMTALLLRRFLDGENVDLQFRALPVTK